MRLPAWPPSPKSPARSSAVIFTSVSQREAAPVRDGGDEHADEGLPPAARPPAAAGPQTRGGHPEVAEQRGRPGRVGPPAARRRRRRRFRRHLPRDRCTSVSPLFSGEATDLCLIPELELSLPFQVSDGLEPVRSVTVTFLDSAPITVWVPAELQPKDPDFTRRVVQEALTHFKQITSIDPGIYAPGPVN